MIQESTESLLDASELTFDETHGDALDGSRPFRSGKRRSSANITGKRSIVRKSAGEGTGIVAKTTVRVDQDGLAHAESFIETFDMDKIFKKKENEPGNRARGGQLGDSLRQHNFNLMKLISLRIEIFIYQVLQLSIR